MSIVVGLVSAALYLHSQVDVAFQIPGIAFWATVFGGLAASLPIIASTFPLLNRITGPAGRPERVNTLNQLREGDRPPEE